MTFLYSLNSDYEARGNGLQAQHLIVPDPLR